MNATVNKPTANVALMFTPVLAIAQWKIKTRNKMKKFLHLIALLYMAASLASCNSDEPEITDDQEVVEKEPLPTNDIVETTVDAKTVVCADGLDEISALFKNRLINENIQPDITPETELVIIDEKSATQFINDKEKYQQLEDLYIRGGLIYLHKPASQCAALVARIQLGVFNEIPEETIPPLYDVYILNIRGSEYNVGDVYGNESQEITYIDEDGNSHTETLENIEEPSEYHYGLYAENAAKFVNAILRGEDSASRTTANYTNLLFVIKQHDYTIYLSQTYKKKDHHMAKDVTLQASGVISTIANIEYRYDAGRDVDVYSITLSEHYPGSKLWLGEKKIHYRGAWDDKYGGFALSKFNVNAYLNYPTANVSLRSADVRNTHRNEKEGLNDKAEVKTNQPLNLNWSFSVDKPLKYSSKRAMNGSVNDYSKIITKDFSVEELWKWEVANSSKIQDYKPDLRINTEYTITSGAASSGIGANHDYNLSCKYNLNYAILLPLPDRYKDNVWISLYLLSGNGVGVEDVLFDNSPTLKLLDYKSERSALSRDRLIYSLSKEWQKVYDELKSANLSSKGLNGDVVMSLRWSDHTEITIGDNEFSRICVNKDGEVSME